jgi:hypothetical protein
LLVWNTFCGARGNQIPIVSQGIGSEGKGFLANRERYKIIHMSFLNSIIKVFVGDKAKKDVQALQPLVKTIKSFEEELQQLNHDELRQKTLGFKKIILEKCRELTDQINN